MTFIDLLYSVPSFLLFFIIIIMTLLVSFSCLYFIEWTIPLKPRFKESQNLGFTGATVGIIYAIIAGFTISYVVNNYNTAAAIVENEANTAGEIFRTAYQLPDPIRSKIQQTILNYVDTVITVEWKDLAHGRQNSAGILILDKLTTDLSAYSPNDFKLQLTEQALFNQLNNLYHLRNERMRIGKASLITEQWTLLFVSSLLTILVNCILGMEFRLHIVTQLAVTLMIAGILYLIISVDRPFSGNFSVKTGAFKAVKMEMMRKY